MPFFRQLVSDPVTYNLPSGEFRRYSFCPNMFGMMKSNVVSKKSVLMSLFILAFVFNFILVDNIVID